MIILSQITKILIIDIGFQMINKHVRYNKYVAFKLADLAAISVRLKYFLLWKTVKFSCHA